MKTLTYVSAKEITDLVWPEVSEATGLYSPATKVFTDFNTRIPRIIEPTLRADILVNVMKKEHVRMKLVVDADNKFIGVVSLEDLSDETFIKQAAQGYSREELLAIDVMRAKENLLALSYTSLKGVDVESLLFSQRENKYQHLLVVDEESQAIRGLVSAHDIIRQLKINVDLSRPTSFARLYEVITKDYANSRRLRVA
ncbi:CBS domain-containing protein [Marinomonas mediterranea]|jgi:CBS domain.|uniref:CBS domain containing protein n=1 Tax=Marinomonas mediterranea (strain ATCC 700492 / JCM 21426 / NBRC 103028 / MMB-1) TaxID=717774 RepID=F2K4M3_MARM1|nr:CBS domain-containing protein [Marinomonas mediterranea]ADZ91416.1 CBS domain containing protein [Marinomonas mediterranea MMB-1]WCN09385.1 CBS domain-containing protein [Marinomonas mediterranea]WCN13462.1 CBS domain-containing protein [Marinomonas mediterranea]WCN17528.1 CBS domain-containing protein [Marinomonas mediterranea MMB-1]